MEGGSKDLGSDAIEWRTRYRLQEELARVMLEELRRVRNIRRADEVGAHSAIRARNVTSFVY